MSPDEVSDEQLQAEPLATDPDQLEAQIAQLDEALRAIRGGGIDSVIVGPPGHEQVHPLMGADRSYRQIVEEMGEGAAAVSEHGIVLYANRQLAQLLTRDRAELVGSGAIQLFAAEDRGVIEGMLQMSPGVTGRVETHLLQRGGTHVPVQLAVTCLDLGDVLLRCLITTDLTSAKQAAGALAESNAALAEHTRNLEQANRELAASNTELAELARVVSQDLAEPLATIDDQVARLTANAPETTAATAESLGLISSGVARMHRLIDGLVAYAQVDTRAQQPVAVAVGDVVGAILADLQARIAEVGAEIRIDSLPRVFADRTQLELVFVNLIRNALTYVDTDRAPVVRLSAERQDAAWQFTVADNGVGIASWHQDQIFQAFRQVDPTRQAGSGIGLAVCKKIVERQGGRIWVENHPGGGSQFRFTLPDHGSPPHRGLRPSQRLPGN